VSLCIVCNEFNIEISMLIPSGILGNTYSIIILLACLSFYCFRYEAELLLRQEHEEKVQQLQEQINFNLNVNKQQQQDLQVRQTCRSCAL